MVLSWKQRMMGCVNLPHDPVAPALKPNVLIINRPVNKGRGFLNIAETVTSLKVSASLLLLCSLTPAGLSA